MKSLFAFTLAIGLSVGSAALAGPREDADAAWRAGDYAKAVTLFRQAAEQGDPVAMTSLARQYEQGSGTAKNLDEAARWNRRAADVFRARAEQGDAEAQYSLGSLYDGHTPGMPGDPAEQLKWVSAAAEHDHIIAQTRLGVLYSSGLGVPKDYVKAYIWWLIASGPHPRELSDRDKRFADIAQRNASDMKSSLTPAQLAQAQKAAAAWKPAPR
jgi:TPR repeat protein